MRDGSGLLTGLLLGLTLPPGLPLWMAFLGGVVSIGLGKLIWGGLGQNLFNPALVGRAFLLATFPVAMTTWGAQAPATCFGSTGQQPGRAADAVRRLRRGQRRHPPGAHEVRAPVDAPVVTAAWARPPGCIGETSALLLLLGGLYLLLRRDIDWRIPAAIAGAVVAFSSLLWLIDAQTYPGPCSPCSPAVSCSGPSTWRRTR